MNICLLRDSPSTIAIYMSALFPCFPQVPQVKGKVLWCELGTPLSDATFLYSYKGGSYGTRCNVDYFSKDSMRWLMRGDTEIDGLFMAGQDAWTPAVAGAMYGGLLGSMKVGIYPTAMEEYKRIIIHHPSMIPYFRVSHKIVGILWRLLGSASLVVQHFNGDN